MPVNRYIAAWISPVKMKYSIVLPLVLSMVSLAQGLSIPVQQWDCDTASPITTSSSTPTPTPTPKVHSLYEKITCDSGTTAFTCIEGVDSTGAYYDCK